MAGEYDDKPFGNTTMAIYLRQRIDELKPLSSQREIALAAGYDKPNIISMFKRGETKVPFDKVFVLAKALREDVAVILRLYFEQSDNLSEETVREFMNRVVSAEDADVVKIWQRATNNRKVRLTEQQAAALHDFIRQLVASPVNPKVVNA